MKCFTWNGGEICQGLALTQDERLGQVLFLGENGRGRRYEKVALGRRNPAEVVNGRVLDAHPVKICLPAKDGKPEKAFYVLEKPRNGNGNAVLVRVYTFTSYIRDGQGRWRVVAGKPETLVSGFGAFGDAGRVGNWDDGLVLMRPGDVLRVYPSRGQHSYALWLDGGKPVTTTWRDYENIQAVAKAQELVGQTSNKPDALDVVFGQMRTFTFAGGQIIKGLKVEKGATGPVIAFGEEGRGRSLIEVPLVGLRPVAQSDQYGQTTEIVEKASVVKLDEKVTPARYSWEKSTVKTIYGLTQTTKSEDAFLVRVSTAGPYTKGTTGTVDPWKGSPTVITSGSGAHGAAGRVGGWDDVLLVMREGDVLFVRSEGGYKSAGPWALFVRGDELRVEFWQEWKLQDAQNDPEFYVAKGTAPMGHTPSEWVSRIVTVYCLSQEQTGCGPTKTCLQERATGELVRIGQDSVVLNLGWDGRDYHEASVSGQWVKLEKDKQVCKLEGEEADKRKQVRTQAEELRNKAIAATKQSHFDLAEANLRRAVQEISKQQGFDTMPTEDGYDSLTSWVEKAKAVVEKWQAAEPEIVTLQQRQNSGEVLVDFGGHFRRMGSTGNRDFWVIRSDGSLRDPDEVSYRKQYTSEGEKQWRLVQADELALVYHKANTADNHHCEVAKLPVCGPSKAQRQRVFEIEVELGVMPGAFGLDPEIADKARVRLEAVKQAYDCLPSDLQHAKGWQEWSFQDIAGQSGVHLRDDYDGKEAFASRVNHAASFGEQCANRDAQAIHAALCADGMLELLAYKKHGRWQLNMRWRETIPASPAGPAEQTPATLEALQAKFGKKR